MKKIWGLLIVFFSMFIFTGGVLANTINSINMDIYVDENGDATVKETWEYKSNTNTEIYHAYPNIGQASITDFKVSDSTGQDYTLVDWDIDESFSNKAYKYGYHYADNGVELCLGISHYGTYTYYLEYKINGFVADVDDAQIIYWTLLQPTSENLKYYYIRIHSDFDYSDELPVWGYGIKGAMAYVYDGVIELTTDRAVKSDEYVTVLAKFEPGTFKTNHVVNKSFDEVLKMADEGKVLYNDTWRVILSVIGRLFFYLIFIIPIIIAAVKGAQGKKKIKEKVIPPKDAPAFRDLPCGDDIFKAYFVASEYSLNKKNTDFLGSLLLKWIRDDVVGIKNEKNKTSIVLSKAPVDTLFANETEKSMYTMMYSAAKDGILEENEFKRYCSSHYEKVLGWFDKVIDEEFEKIKLTDVRELEGKKGLFNKTAYEATEALNETALRMAGLKNFYKEFGSIQDKSAIEVKLWREHLMYAQILGVAEKVAKEFKKLYPDVIQSEELSTVVYVNHFYTTGVSAASSARSRAQSYSSGGGGFSSGGGGGGSFGGGGSMGSR